MTPMETDSSSIRSALQELVDLPTPVRSWHVEEGLDATDDPAVWVWAVIEHDDVDTDTLGRLKDLVRNVVREATGGLWAYVLIRGANETEVAP